MRCPVCELSLEIHTAKERAACTEALRTPPGSGFTNKGIADTARQVAGPWLADVRTLGINGVVLVRLELSRWAWLALGALHWWTARNLSRRLEEIRPVGLRALLVEVGPFSRRTPAALRIVRD